MLGSTKYPNTEEETESSTYSKEDALVLEATCELCVTDQDALHGAHIDSGAQNEIIDFNQAKDYILQYGGTIKTSGMS